MNSEQQRMVEPVAVAPPPPSEIPLAAGIAKPPLSSPPPPPPPPPPGLAEASAAAGVKRSLSATSGGINRDGKQLSEKKLRRLEKNRLSARECRRRKREATENLQRQINLLEGENLRLRLQLRIGEEAEESMGKEQEKVTEEIDKLLKSGASDAEIHATIEEFKEKFADYGKDRRTAIEFHLRNMERLLMPTQTTSIALTALQGGAASSKTIEAEQPGAAAVPTPSGPPTEAILSKGAESKGLDPKALFKHLVQHLKVTPEQAAALKDSRWVAKDLDDFLKESKSVLGELRNGLAQIGEELENEFSNVRAILTPTQSAKFVVWVANNRACMHMLDELWDRDYQAPDEKKESPER